MGAKAATALTRAQTAQLYVDMQVLDPSEVRKGLASTDEFDIEGLLDNQDTDPLDWGMEELPESGFQGDIPPKSLISSGENSIIKERNEDGGPGSGRYPKGSGGNKVDYKAAGEFTKTLKGTTASNGVQLKEVSGHAAYRMKSRNINVDTLKDVLINPDITYPGNNKNKNATCFQKQGKRIVFSSDGTVITAVDLEEDDD